MMTSNTLHSVRWCGAGKDCEDCELFPKQGHQARRNEAAGKLHQSASRFDSTGLVDCVTTGNADGAGRDTGRAGRFGPKPL